MNIVAVSATYQAMRAMLSSSRRRKRRRVSGSWTVDLGQVGQLGRGHADPEQADGQQVEHHRVGEGGDGARRQVAGEQQVDPAHDLDGTPAQQHRHEPAEDAADPLAGRVEAEADACRAAAAPGTIWTPNCSTPPISTPKAR